VPKLKTATFTAFGMTKRSGRSAANDEVLAEVVNAGTPAVCLVGKSHDFHVETALGIPLDENLTNIRESIAHLVAQGREALFDAEHFFDGYNGGTLPGEVAEIVATVCQRIPGTHVGIHTHNDTEQAVANTFAAIDAGARQIQGTLNGLGERCGNANLVSIIPTLLLKPRYADRC
jgi:2-isopropylmalate synthase